jgi:enoyl-CoA hydratase/carnithine racemase
MTGVPFGAEQALALGAVNRLCAPDNLMDEVLAIAKPGVGPASKDAILRMDDAADVRTAEILVANPPSGRDP